MIHKLLITLTHITPSNQENPSLNKIFIGKNSLTCCIKHKSTFTSHSHSHNSLLHSSTVTSQKTNTNNAFLQKNLQKENIKNSSLPSPDNVSTRPFLSLISQNKTNTFQPTTPTLPLLTKNHANNTTHANCASILSLTSSNILLATKQQDKHSMTSLTSKYQCNNNTHLDKKQNILSHYGQINTIKKNKKDKKKPNKDIGSPTKEKLIDTLDPLTKIPEEKAKQKPLCYKCHKLGHYQNNCKPPKNKSKLNIPEFHSEINSLKQEIQEIKNSSFQITEEQLAQEIVTLNMNDNHLQDSNVENEVEPEENCKQIVQSITQPTFKENLLNTIDKMLFQKWYTEVRIVIDKEYVFQTVALLDTGVDSNCIQEGLIPAKYYEKTTEKLSQASGASLNIEFKLPNAHVCRDGVCIKTTFILVKDITSKVILGNPFIALLYPIKQI